MRTSKAALFGFLMAAVITYYNFTFFARLSEEPNRGAGDEEALATEPEVHLKADNSNSKESSAMGGETEKAEQQPEADNSNSKESSAIGVETEIAEQQPEADNSNSKESSAMFETTIGSSPLVSTVHCVGETFTDKAWAHRSCEFTNICFDRKRKDFVLFKPEASSGHQHQGGTYVSSSSSYDLSLSLGGINPRWNWGINGGIEKLKWFPRILNGPLIEDYHRMEDVTLIPWHCMNGLNVGHLLWDDFLPLYTLLGMFSLEQTKLFIVRHILDEPLWATCEFNPSRNKGKCEANFEKWFKIMGVGAPFFTNKTLHEQVPVTSNYLCFDRAVAGLGLLTDHGDKLHGWAQKDYEISNNIGRGRIMWEFRSFMLENLKIDSLSLPKSKPRIITVSCHSSNDSRRSLSFDKQVKILRERLGGDDSDVVINQVKFAEYSVEEQAKIAIESSVMITAVGGGAVTATFLPKGATLVLFFPFDNNHQKGTAARLDWDYFNNAAYMRTHWFPIETMNEDESLTALADLVAHELQIISSHH
ncbi:hypothetical protein TrCOL_g7273 [Triparma columacea]|uniref:Glycosyltransferase n=1 Tax=Triparma columacea TaxID=722753 RepID=A0A9W7GNE8_9STRA|nr:hypothetical protein TrCOL_g7273 [Triparma columacea]